LHLVEENEERESVAKLFVETAEKAREQRAYDIGRDILRDAERLATDASLKEKPDFVYKLYMNLLECEGVTGFHDKAEEAFQGLLKQDLSEGKRNEVFALRFSQICTPDPSGNFVELACSFLSEYLGQEQPVTIEEQGKLSADMLSEVIPLVLGGALDELGNMPIDGSKDRNAVDATWYYIASGMYNHRPSMYPAVVAYIVKNVIKNGPSEYSAVGIAGFSIILMATGYYDAARKLKVLTGNLVARSRSRHSSQIAKVISLLYVSTWITAHKENRSVYDKEFDSALEYGNLLQAEYIPLHGGGIALCGGWNVKNTQEFLDEKFSMLNGINTSGHIAQFNTLYSVFYNTLAEVNGAGDKKADILSEEYDDLMEGFRLVGDVYIKILRAATCLYFRRYSEVVGYLGDPAEISRIIPANIIGNEAQFFYAIGLSQSIDAITGEEGVPQELASIEKLFAELVNVCKENFFSRHAVIQAEIERINGNYNKAIDLFVAAADSAKAHDMPNIEGLSLELAFNLLYKSKKFKEASGFLEKACNAYSRWGADAKVDALKKEFGQLLQNLSTFDVKEDVAETSQEKDNYQQALDAAISVSATTVRDDAISTLLKSLQGVIGSSSVVMIDADEQTPLLGCCEMVDGNIKVSIGECHAADGKAWSSSVINIVRRTGEAVIVNDPLSSHITANDKIIKKHNPKSIMAIPVINSGTLISILYFENMLIPDFFNETKKNISQNIASLSAGILESARLYSDLSKAEKELGVFSKRLVETQENERKRIASELHDSLAQEMLVIKNEAKSIEASDALSDESARGLKNISETATRSLQGIKEICQDLRPQQLDLFGLKVAIESLASKISNSSNIEIETRIDHESDTLPPDIAINLYRIIQEGFNNIIKHSGATTASIDMKIGKDFVDITISDNGVGLEAKKAGSKSGESGSFGLQGMEERCKLFGGVFCASSDRGTGTTIRATLPLEK
jgi:signal transduction histidine kinase